MQLKSKNDYRSERNISTAGCLFLLLLLALPQSVENVWIVVGFSCSLFANYSISVENSRTFAINAPSGWKGKLTQRQSFPWNHFVANKWICMRLCCFFSFSLFSALKKIIGYTGSSWCTNERVYRRKGNGCCRERSKKRVQLAVAVQCSAHSYIQLARFPRNDYHSKKAQRITALDYILHTMKVNNVVQTNNNDTLNVMYC